MRTINSKQLDQKFDIILCDSIDALEFCYKNGLSKNIKVLSHSPSILLNKNIKSENLYNSWTRKKIIEYQKGILPFTKDIFKTINQSSKYEIELATLACVFANQLSNFILKLSHLKNNLSSKKILFIKLDNNLENAKNINPPWDTVSSELNLYSYKYNPKNYSSVSNNSKFMASFLKRLHLGGMETIIYRIAMKLNILNFFKKKNNIIVINENEMIIELTSKLFIKGYKIIDFRNINLKNNERGKFNFNKFQLITKNIFKARIKKWLPKNLQPACLNYIENEFEIKTLEYLSWKKIIIEKFSNHKINEGIVLMNHPSSPKGLAIKNVCQKKNIKMISCQHGVTAEISDSHDYCLSQHDSSSSDIYIAFNKGSFEIAKNNPFNQTKKQFLYGAPKRYYRTGKLINYFKKFDILYLSNNLYAGNLGGVSNWSSDLEKAKIEINIINLLEKINKNIFFKPYPEINKRYYEENPCLRELKNKKNLTEIKNNYDSRYILNKTNLIICATATSTVAWAIMSNTPTVFINFKYLAPLKPEAYYFFTKGLFLFDYEKSSFSKDISNFLSKNNKEINYLWQKKIKYREILKENFISSKTSFNINNICN